MTILDLAKKSGVSKRMISAYEAGENDITFKKLQNIAEALGVWVIDLIIDEQGVIRSDSPLKKTADGINFDNKDQTDQLIALLLKDKEILQKTIDEQHALIKEMSKMLIETSDKLMGELIKRDNRSDGNTTIDKGSAPV